MSVNSAAVSRPQLLDELAERFGSQCVVLAIDAKRRVDAARPTAGRSSSPAVARRPAATPSSGRVEGVRRGAGEILLTSMDRDGTKDGYDLELTRAVAEAVDVPVIASGGAGDLDDLVAALEAGADAALVASIFHFGEYTVAEAKARLLAAGVNVAALAPATPCGRGRRCGRRRARSRPAASGCGTWSCRRT